MSPSTETRTCEDLGDPCQVFDWVYCMDSINPRMYGGCTRCGTQFIVQLPRRRCDPIYDGGQFEAVVEYNVAARNSERRVIDASESALRRSGVSQKLPGLFDAEPLRLTQDILSQYEEFTRRELTAQIRADLEAELAEKRAGLQRYGRYLDKAWKDLGERERVVARVEDEHSELLDGVHRLQDTADNLTDMIRRERDNARREPLPVPPGYVPPDPAAAAVLCADISAPEVIYALVDPSDPELVRYIGRTNHPEHRYKAHVTRGAGAVQAWVKELRAAGRLPLMVLIERCTSEAVTSREAYWIAHYRARYQADLNSSIPRLTREMLDEYYGLAAA